MSSAGFLKKISRVGKGAKNKEDDFGKQCATTTETAMTVILEGTDNSSSPSECWCTGNCCQQKGG